MSIEPMSDLAAELIALEKAKSPQPTVDETERLLRRLESTLVLRPVVSADLGAPVTSSGAIAATAAGIKLSTGLAMMAVGVMAGSAATVVFMKRPEPVVVQMPVVVPPVEVAVTPLPPPIHEAVPAPVSPMPKKASAVPLSKLAAEQPLLDMARSAIMSGRAQAALVTLRRHARDFPEGELAEEREALFVQALAQSGDQAAAAAKAGHFRKRFPQSIFLPSVDAAAPP